jgi:signal peptidase I
MNLHSQMKKAYLFFTALAVLSLLHGCRGFRGVTFRIPTNSMSPTVKPGDSVFADPVFYKHTAVNRGDVVVVIDPDGKRNVAGQPEMYVKRVIGLGGDKVRVTAARVYVNDSLVEGILGSGKYESNFQVDDFGPVEVPGNRFFLLGDNLPDSIDSRQWKRPFVELEAIYGKVTTIKDGKTGAIRYL